MKNRRLLMLLLFPALVPGGWNMEDHPGYHLYFHEANRSGIGQVAQWLDRGKQEASAFFSTPFKEPFDVYVHPGRSSLDSTWQHDWNMPGFHSECWMVASGTATRLDMIAPATWDRESCEHSAADTAATRKLLAHELVHVFHGQRNASPDFGNTEGIDWLVEGLATYVSGQCDSARLAGVRTAIREHKAPEHLDDFWKGNLRYGLSGSVVMYIDHKFGRAKLKELLPFSKKTEVLSALGVSEDALVAGWKEYFTGK